MRMAVPPRSTVSVEEVDEEKRGSRSPCRSLGGATPVELNTRRSKRFELRAARCAGRRLDPETCGRCYMAKKVVGIIKLQVRPARRTRRRRSVRRSVNAAQTIMEFCKAFNAATQNLEPACRSRW